jgi:membrane protein DedA with SNARE-associated domain
VNEVLDEILRAVQSVDPVLRTLLAGVGILLETSILLGLLVPGDSVVIVAATGVGSPAEFVGLVVVVISGALGGESIGFALGRYFGPRIRSSRLGARIGEKSWRRAENYLERRGGIAVFVSRFLPVLHSLIPVTVGMSTMRYRVFLAWTAPACALWALAYVGVGSAAAGGYRELSEGLHTAGYLFAGALVLFVVGTVVLKKLLHRREARHMGEPDAGSAARESSDVEPTPR